jgi:type IV secretory pathway VirB10-like protein
MNNGFKTNFIEHKHNAEAAVIDELPDEKLAAQALEDIRNTERLSGVGRFATKMQNLFQASGPSQTKQQSSHLKAAPIMMSAGVLLLLATGLLFLISKPESAVHSHFRPPTGLSGADDRKPVTRSNTESPVTESQLVGSDAKSDTESANRSEVANRSHEERAARRFSFANDGAATPANSSTPAAAVTSELRNPATVFVANPVSNAVLNPLQGLRATRDSEVQLPSGTEITAHTTNAISSGLESPVIAVVDRNIQLGDAIVIPQGARIIGYTAGAVKDRINVRFTSLILPNNREITISGLALMKDGSAGLLGKVQGSGHPILANAGRVATGASALAIQFAGQNNQPFSQADYLRNQLASEVASEGSRYSNRLQQPTNVPIVTVNTNQSIRIFLLNAMSVADGRIHSSKPAQQTDTATTLTVEQNQSRDQALAAAQTAYIQALESQLADMRAALDARKSNVSH